MMRVERKPAPVNFESAVGRKGKRVLDKHRPKAPVASSFWKGKDHWTKALDDLMSAYGRVCAFTGFGIAPVTGARSVEHFRPKSKYPELAYDWDNFRLICSLMNGRKGDNEDVLDPFRLPRHTYDLESVTGTVVIHRDCPKGVRKRAQSTISRLKLNSPDCRQLRLEHLDKIYNKDWSLAEAKRQSPFLVACLEEQGLI